MRVTGVRLDGERVDDRLAFDEGFHGAEPPLLRTGEEIARWSSASAALRIASDGSDVSTISVRLSCLEPRVVTLRSAVDTTTVTVGRDAEWVDVAIPPEPFDVINNVGSNLFGGGFGGDRGFLEVDDGQYEEPADVFAWCGGAVLLERAYLDDVGTFDERFFLYYEDTDLSWRGQLRGWRYVYAPGAVVRHHHASSAGVGSPLFRYCTERNRLLMLAKNAPWRLAWRSGLGEVRRAITDDDPALRVASADAAAAGPPGGRPSMGGVFRLPAAAPRDAARPLVVGAHGVTRRRDALGGRQMAAGVTPKSASADRLRVAVYDLYWSTLGGGEQVDGSIAQVLAADHDVTLLGPHPADVGRDVSAGSASTCRHAVTAAWSTTSKRARRAPTSTCSSTART